MVHCVDLLLWTCRPFPPCVQANSWLASLLFQFLPNLLVFVSMYILIPMALTYLSRFEGHLTVSGEQCAVLRKLVVFYILNLFVLKVRLLVLSATALRHRCIDWVPRAIGSCLLVLSASAVG